MSLRRHALVRRHSQKGQRRALQTLAPFRWAFGSNPSGTSISSLIRPEQLAMRLASQAVSESLARVLAIGALKRRCFVKGSNTPEWGREGASLRRRLQPSCIEQFGWCFTRVFFPAFYRATGRSASCGALLKRIEPVIDIYPLSRKGEPCSFSCSVWPLRSATGWAVGAALGAPEHCHGPEPSTHKKSPLGRFHDPYGSTAYRAGVGKPLIVV